MAALANICSVRDGCHHPPPVTSQGTPAGQLLRALDTALARGDLDLSLACARDLPAVTLTSAARLLNLMAREHSPLFDKAAARWLTRFIAEVPGVTAEQIAEIADAIADLPDMNAAETLLGAVKYLP
jgi:molybdopterin-guanine dinucleotide biosynthesis protein A